MNDKLALNQDSLNQYSSLNYENLNKYPTFSSNYEYTSLKYKNNSNYHGKKINTTIEEAFDLLNKYGKTRNYDIISNYNNLVYSNEQRKEKKLEFSKSMDKILKSNKYELNYIYNNKSLSQINKEIIKFKDKMNKDKNYLKNIQNKIFYEYELLGEGQKRFYNNPLNEDIIKNKKRAYSLTNRANNYENFPNLKENYQYNDYLSEKRKIKNIIINNNNFINNNLIYKRNLSYYQDINFKENDFSKNKIKNNFPRRNNSFYSINNNDIFNKIIFNNSIKKNNYLDKEEKDPIKTNKIKNINDYEYIRYPERKSFEKKQNDFSNMKYLTIQTKNDKIQLKEKEIKINDISNLNKEPINNNYGYNISTNPKNFTQPNNKTNEQHNSMKYQSRKYDKFINNIINEDSKENNINLNDNDNTKFSLNDKLLSNFENIKKKYNETNKINNTSSFNIKNLYRKRSATYIKEDKIGEEKNSTIISNKNSVYNNLNSKYFEDINLINIKKKYSNTIKNEENLNFIEPNYNKYMISSFYINIEKNENYNKDLLINNLNQKLLDFENQLKIANNKIKQLSEILEKIKNKNKILYIDKINSFNYFQVKNHFIKINKRKFEINIEKPKNNPTLNNEELVFHFSNRSIKRKNNICSDNLNSISENEHHSYSSFDNYKNMNLYFTKVTSINEKKSNKISNLYTLNKIPSKYNKNILLNKINNSKEEINIKNKNLLIKDINMNEKIIYTLYFHNGKLNVLFFDPELKKFSIQKFRDNGNFEENYKDNLDNTNSNKKDNGNIFLFNEGFLYVITGKDYNMFYHFNPNTKEINNLCKLKYNHSNGNLIYYDQRIFCLSGNNNKKVECYIESKNEWIEIPEMLTERSNFSTCIIKEQYLFALFGYNSNKQYLDSIEFIDLLCENSEWKYLDYENKTNLSLFLIDFLGINYDDKKIIIFGGYDGQNNMMNQYFYQINLKKNFEEESDDINNDNLTDIIKLDKTMKFNFRNECFFLDLGYNKYYGENNNWIYTFFDKDLNAHIININDFSQESFNFQ